MGVTGRRNQSFEGRIYPSFELFEYLRSGFSYASDKMIHYMRPQRSTALAFSMVAECSNLARFSYEYHD